MIDRAGCLRLTNPSFMLGRNAEYEPCRATLAPLVRGKRDYGNGYCWLTLNRMTFGGEPCGAALCFFENRLKEAAWSVSLSTQKLEGGWPTKESSDAEIAFIRGELVRQLGRSLPTGLARFDWGEVWSIFDEKGYSARSGLRWRQPG